MRANCIYCNECGMNLTERELPGIHIAQMTLRNNDIIHDQVIGISDKDYCDVSCMAKDIEELIKTSSEGENVKRRLLKELLMVDYKTGAIKSKPKGVKGK